MFASRPPDLMFEPLQIVGGAATRGIVQRPSDSVIPPVDFAPPRFVVRVRHDSLLHAGQVITRRAGGDHYVLANCHETKDYQVFWMIQAYHQAAWTRRVETTEPLTGLKKSDTESSLGNIWVAWEPQSRETFDRDLRLGEENVRVLTGADVRMGDKLDNRLVKRVQPVLGIRLITVQ